MFFHFLSHVYMNVQGDIIKKGINLANERCFPLSLGA